MSQKVFVLGHQHPDTDSIASAIAYTYLKRQLGVDAQACRLGKISDETDYILNRFGFEYPMLMKDARAVLGEVQMDPIAMLHQDASLKDAIALIQGGHQTVAVVDEEGYMVGVISNTNLSVVAMGDTAETVSLLKDTSIDNIVNVVDGTLVVRPVEFNYNGKTSIVALNEKKLEPYDVEQRLVILGDDVEAQLSAIDKGASCIVLVWAKTVDERVIAAAKARDCAIIQSAHGSMNTSRYILLAPSVKQVMKRDVVSFNVDEFVDDVGKEMLTTRYRSYPVLDRENKLHGFVSRFHVLNSQSKKLILVDHNEMSQSIAGIEDADVLEVVDHHRIGDITTTKPIYFRNEIIGSTASIITKMFGEYEIEIPQNIASILLSALVSDTLNLKSPTTTPQDFEIAKTLESRSGLDRFELAKDMFQAASSLVGKTPEEVFQQDVKKFMVQETPIMVSQVIVYNFDEVLTMMDAFNRDTSAFAKANDVELLVVVFTSIEDNASMMIASGEYRDAVYQEFDAFNGTQMNVLKDVVSRKNQILPRISTAISKAKEK